MQRLIPHIGGVQRAAHAEPGRKSQRSAHTTIKAHIQGSPLIAGGLT